MASQIKTEDDFKKRYEFTIHDQIGSGGFGTVFRAKDKARNDRIVAIKRAEIKLNAEFTLKKEFNLCNELNHRNIVRYEACYTFKNEHGGHEYIVMEFYEEGNLEDFLNKYKDQLTEAEKKSIIKDILVGLKYLHEQNFIHRDLKPENILVKRHENGHKWEAVIADFGTSRLVGTDAHTKIKMSGANPFSIAFAAPEQILASKLGLKNVDLWSVGIIIYRIIIGELPFTPDAADTTFIKLSKKITSGELPSKVHQLPEPYKSMVLTCLKVNIEQRVQTAQELINLLEIVVVPHPPFNAHLLAQIGAFYGFVLSVLFGVLQTYFLHSVNLLTATPWEIKLIPNVISQFIYFSIPIFLSITFYHFYTSNKRQLHFSEGFWMGLLMLSIFGLGCYIICDINYRSLVEQCSLNSSIPKFRQIKDNLWNDWRNAPMLLFKYCKWGGIWLIVLLGLVFGLNNWRTTQ